MITPDDLKKIVMTPWVLKDFGTYDDGITPHCASVLRYAYHQCGVILPEDYIQLIESFKRIPNQEYKFLDAIFMSLRVPFIDHVAVYLGDGTFIHAPRGGNVSIHKLNDEYWQQLIKGILRYKAKDLWMNES